MGLMLFMLIAGIGLAAAGLTWKTEVKREKERQLLFVGEEFRRAIGSYYESTPGDAKQFPLSLEELLKDARFPGIKRHLRQVYRDPMTGGVEWGLVREQGRIVGVFSLSEHVPLKKAGFKPEETDFVQADQYKAWRFVYKPTNTSVTNTEALVATAGHDDRFNLSSTPNINSTSDGAKDENASGKSDSTSSTDNAVSSRQDRSRQQECLGQRMSDTSACTFYCKEKGTGSACTRCQASILQRYRACLESGTLPPLYNSD